MFPAYFAILCAKSKLGRHCLPLSYTRLWRPNGFSIVELLIGAVVLVAAALLLLSVFSLSTRFVRESKSINSKEALIDADISLVEAELAKISYCDGTQKLLTACNGQAPGGEAFYAPVASSSSSIMSAMEADCNNGDIVSDAPGSPSLAISSLRSLALPVGIVRSVSAYDPSGLSSTKSPIHTVLLTYSYEKNSVQGVSRIYLLRAPVANYCP